MSKHSCHHHHHHDHHHSHVPNNRKVLWISFILITLFMYVELIGGYISNSLALIADAGHMLTDAFSLGLAVLASVLSQKKSDRYNTFGYGRSEILAAAFNGILLFIIAFYIAYEAIERIFLAPEILSKTMLIIAIIGLIVNIIVASLMWLYGDVEDNLNVRAAFLHVLADMLGSVGAIIAALLVMFFNWHWADTVASVIVSFIILRSAFYVLKQSIQILMQNVPKQVNIIKIRRILLQHDFVISVRHLHVWQLNQDYKILTCHVKVDNIDHHDDYQHKLHSLVASLNHYHLNEITIQLET